MSAVLSVSGLTMSFGPFRVLEDITFELAEGEVLALIGPNGAGKSTCFNLIGGQLVPEAGRVVLAGRAVTGRPDREIGRLGLGRTFQIPATYASFTVAENVQLAFLSAAGRTRGLWTRAASLHRREALDLLESLGLAALAERPCGVLAYGDLKRIELALALAGKPRLLLMDEPTAGMAPAERARFMADCVAFARARNLPILFTEHDMDVIFNHATRVLVLEAGRLIAQGSPAQVAANERVRAVYLGHDFAGLEGAAC